MAVSSLDPAAHHEPLQTKIMVYSNKQDYVCPPRCYVICGDHASWTERVRVRSQGLDEHNPIWFEALAVIRNREDL